MILGEPTGESAPILWGMGDKEGDQKVELCRESPQRAGVMHPPHDNVALVSNSQHGQTALEQKQQTQSQSSARFEMFLLFHLESWQI